MVISEPSAPWFSDRDLWAEFEDVIFGATRMARAGLDVDGVERLAGIKPGTAVLDVCCGPGRHSLELSRRGYLVTGVDLNPGYLQRATAAAQAEELDIEFVHSDALEFVRPAAFDAAINMYSSFGYFDTIGDDLRLLQNIHTSLRPGGALLIETMGKETVARTVKDRSWFRLGGEDSDDIVFVENNVIGAWERVELAWTLVRGDGRRSTASLNIRLYSAVEMGSLLREAGFSSVSVYGDMQGRRYSVDASLLVAVARRE